MNRTLSKAVCTATRLLACSLLLVAAVLATASISSATAIYVTGSDLTGDISTEDGGLVASGTWADGYTINWVIGQDTGTGYWNYSYTFDAGDGHATSHLIFEVSDTFEANNIWNLQVDGENGYFQGPGTYGVEPGNPGIPGDIYGIKVEPLPDINMFTLSFTSDRAPIWGDVYAKDGVGGRGGDDTYLYNAGFGTEPTLDRLGLFIPTPDTATTVPEPGTMMLLGSGLIGLAEWGRRRLRR